MKKKLFMTSSLVAVVVAFVLAAFAISPISKAADAPNDVYLSATGSDEGDGTESAPFLSLDKAIETVADNGTIHVSGICYVKSWTAHGKSVKIVGGNPVNDQLHFGQFTPDPYSITINDDVYFQNVNLRYKPDAYLFANGNTVTLAEDVVTENVGYICGGSNGGTTEGDTNLTVLAGCFKGIYGGGKGDTVTGNTNLVVGGCVNTSTDASEDVDVHLHSGTRMVYAGGRDGSVVQGSANLTYGGSAKASYIFGGTSGANGSIGKGSFLKITGGSAVGFFGGGKGSTHNTDVHVLMTGGSFEQGFGGSHSAAVTGDVDVQILGGTITRRLYGGCYNEWSLSWTTNAKVSGNITLSIGGDANITLDQKDTSGTAYDDRSIYACSRLNSNDENTTLNLVGETAQTAYAGKLGAQDSIMQGLMSGINVSDTQNSESENFYSDITWWKNTASYPEREGVVFAGWYADDQYKTAYKGSEGAAYAKYVDAKVLTAKKQLRTNLSPLSESTDVRFLTSIDSNQYKKAGFDVTFTYSGGTKTYVLEETTVYSSILAAGQKISDAASVFGSADSKYFVTHTLTGVPNSAFSGTFEVTPYWYTLDGTKVSGDTDTFAIEDYISVSGTEIEGMDGIISEGEYAGKILDSTKGASESENYKITAQGFVTDEQNLRVAITVNSKTKAPDEVVNPASDWSEYQFVELGFGVNGGTPDDCNIIRADVLGKTKDALSVVKTTDNGESAEYRYTTVIELFIEKDKITENPTPNMVQFTRCALFHQNDADSKGINETWLVLRSAWDNAGMNNCYVTTEGILDTYLLAGMDGEISDSEYAGKILDSTKGASNSANYRLTAQGYVADGKNLRVALTVDSVKNPNTVVNPEDHFSQYMFAELGFGNNGGDTHVRVDVLGKTQNAVTVVKTTENEAGADYAYTTVIEMWIPNAAFSVGENNPTPNLVQFTRCALFHKTDADNNVQETWLVLRSAWDWAGMNNTYVTTMGIKDSYLVANIDGTVNESEYKGITLDSTKGASDSIDYKLTAKGYVSDGQNLKVALTIDSTRDPNTVVNPDDQWSKYLFAELGFGNNGGDTCVKVDVLGNAENAITAVKTTDHGEGAEGYRYTTVIEMWIPKAVFSEGENNPTPNMVQFTRCAIFHKNFANPEGTDTTWLVLRSAWDGAGMNNCYVTTEGIVESWLLAGMDGTIAENEYMNSRTDLTTTTLSWLQFDAKVSLKGYLQGEGIGSHTVRLAIQVDSNTAPDADVNSDSTLFSKKRYFELSLGNNNGDLATPYTPVRADGIENVQNAVSVVKTTDNGEGAEYRYTTIIELWVPVSGISNDTNTDLVHLPRFKYYSNNEENWIAQTPGNFGWAYIQADGIH